MIDMKKLSFLSLGTALALGAAATLSVAPALAAKKEKAPKLGDAPKVELSKEFRAAAGPVEADIKAGKLDGMSARLDALSAQFKLPDEQFIIGGRRYELGKATNNSAELRKAVITMIDSKSSLSTNAAQLNGAAGQYAYNARDFGDALARLSEAVRLGNKDPDTFILMAESSFQLGKIPEGLGFAERAVAEKKALGQVAPADWYQRALSVAVKAKSQPEIAKWSRNRVSAYPTPQNWRDALLIYKDGARLEGQPALDVMRLIRSAKALAGERDYFEYAALATERGLPGEAKSVIEEGMASGAIGKTSRPINELLAAASAKVGGDLASLATSEKRASSDAAGKIAAGTADAYLGYGQDSKAAPLYKIALQKGQVDNDTVNTRLGIALARQGQSAEARQAFAAVGGTRAEIAKYWMLWLDLKGQTPAK
jgi:Flp pilus assembly protein TadD